MTKIRNSLRWALIGLTVTLVFNPRESHAEPVDSVGILQQVGLYDALLLYPQPAWISGPIEPEALRGRSRFFTEQDGPTYIIEQIPDGQNFRQWTRLYAVVAEELPGDQGVPMQSFVGLSVEANRRACADTAFGVQVLSSGDTDTMLAMVCGSTDHGPLDVGYGPDLGEVSIWRFLVFQNTYIKIYHRWRGDAFDINTREGWPVGDLEVQEIVRRMTEQVSVSPNTGNR